MPLVIYVFGISEDRLIMQAMILLYAAAMQFYHVFVLKGIQRSVFRLRQSNITHVDFGMHEHISYEDCRCNVISIESCLDNLHFKYTMIKNAFLTNIINIHQACVFSLHQNVF